MPVVPDDDRQGGIPYVRGDGLGTALLPQGSADHGRNHRDGDVIEHDRDDDLVGAGDCLQQSWDEPPERPCQDARRERHGDGYQGWSAGQRDPCGDGAQRAEQELPLRPDVEQASLECQAHRQSAKDEWSR